MLKLKPGGVVPSNELAGTLPRFRAYILVEGVGRLVIDQAFVSAVDAKANMRRIIKEHNDAVLQDQIDRVNNSIKS